MPRKSKLLLLWPRTRRGIKSITSHIRCYVTHITRALGHTTPAKGEYCNVVPDHCIDHKTSENISSIFQAENLDQQALSE